MNSGIHKNIFENRKSNAENSFFILLSDFHSPFYIHRLPFFALKLCLAFFVFFQINLAQQDEMEAPPPVKILSKAEKSQLDAETNVKQRTKLALDLMDARLLKAETASAAEDYPLMFTELGGFHALMDNTIAFLSKSGSDSGKVLNNFKRFEITLRKYITRLELIRRDLPRKYEAYVRRLVKYVREARSKAVEPLFDDSVLPSDE